MQVIQAWEKGVPHYAYFWKMMTQCAGCDYYWCELTPGYAKYVLSSTKMTHNSEQEACTWVSRRMVTMSMCLYPGEHSEQKPFSVFPRIILMPPSFWRFDPCFSPQSPVLPGLWSIMQCAIIPFLGDPWFGVHIWSLFSCPKIPALAFQSLVYIFLETWKGEVMMLWFD